MDGDKNTPDIVFDRVEQTTCSLCGCEIDVSGLEPFLTLECPDCGNMESVPGRLGPFLLINLIGTGGMGGVYRARDIALGRYVAIKVMLSSVGEDLEFIETFRREAQAAAKLNHPNIAQIYSFGQEKGQPYIVMEIVEGKRFDKMVEESALDQGLVMQVGLNIAEGLQAAEEFGLIHGDIKPENILLDEKMNAKLVDFGIATFGQGKQEGIWGTPYYIAPEKLKRQKVDARSDIYSLGATLYHALAGRPPFEGDTPIEVVKARLTVPPTPLNEVRRDINEKVASVIHRMLEVEPSKRHPNYGSLINDFRKAIKEVGGVSRNMLTKKGKKVVINKKTTSEVRPLPTRSSPPSEKRPTIKVRKNTTSTFEPVDGKSAIDKYKKTARESNAPAQESGGSKAILWIFLVLLFLGLIGGGVFLTLAYKEKKKQEQLAYLEMLALNQNRETASKTYIAVMVASTNIISIAESSEKVVIRMTEAVQKLSGVTLSGPAAPEPAPKEPEKKPAKDEAAPAEKKETKTDASSSVAPGMPTLEQLEAQRAGKPLPAEQPADKKPAAPAVEAVSDDPMVAIGQQVIKMAGEIQAAAQIASQAEIVSFTKKSAVDTASTSAIAAQSLKDLQGDLARMQTLEQNSRETLAKMESKTAEVEKKKDEVEKAENAKNQAAMDEAARIKAEEEAARKAEQHEALVKNEMALIENLRKMNEVHIKQNKFDEAKSAMKLSLTDFKSSEGKAAAEIQLERYDRLCKLKEYLIAQISSEPIKWGWGKGQTARDIVGASKKGLSINGMKDVVPWEEVPTGQMINIINHYLGNRKTRIRDLGEQSLATALYCYESARDNENAVKMARKFADSAVEYCSDLKEITEKLLPE